MARNDWRGDSQAIAQVRRFTIGGTVVAGDTVGITINRKTATYTAVTDDTVELVAAGLAAAWAAALWPESKEAEAIYTDGDDFIDLTATEPGRPFTATAEDTGTTTNTASDEVDSAGPNHVDDPENWTLGTVPTTGDDVVVNGGAAMLYGLGSITADSWEFREGYTQPVGLPAYNSAGYVEYRTRELTIDSADVVVRCGSNRMNLKAVASSTWRVEATGQRETEDVPALDVGATGNPTRVEVSGGDVGVLTADETTARTLATLAVTGDESRVTLGRLLTATALDMDRGTVGAFGTVTTATVGRGDYTQHDGTLTTLNAWGGYIRLNHAGTVTTVKANGRGAGDPGPVIDCEANNRARTFTNSEFLGGAYLLDENKTVALTDGGTHTADAAFFANARLGPRVTWDRA